MLEVSALLTIVSVSPTSYFLYIYFYVLPVFFMLLVLFSQILVILRHSFSSNRHFGNAHTLLFSPLTLNYTNFIILNSDFKVLFTNYSMISLLGYSILWVLSVEIDMICNADVVFLVLLLICFFGFCFCRHVVEEKW